MSTGDNKRVNPGVPAADPDSYGPRGSLPSPRAVPLSAKMTPWRPAPRPGRVVAATPPTLPRLRVQDIDLARNEIILRDGKGAKDRVTMLPESLKATLRKRLRVVKTIHEQDLADGWGRVQMPRALDRKYRNAASDWRWQWIFPQENRWKNPKL